MDVKDVYKKYDVLIFHGTKLGGGADSFFDTNIEVKVSTRIKSVVESYSTISCFLYRRGKQCHKFWCPIGVIIYDGEVIDTLDETDGSSLDKNGDRIALCSQSKKIEEKVEEAVTQELFMKELLIRQHREYGIFICLESRESLSYVIPNQLEFHNETKDLKLKYFIILRGKIYEAIFDRIIFNYDTNHEISIEDIHNEIENELEKDE